MVHEGEEGQVAIDEVSNENRQCHYVLSSEGYDRRFGGDDRQASLGSGRMSQARRLFRSGRSGWYRRNCWDGYAGGSGVRQLKAITNFY